jgi:hypothetical protein
MLSDVRRPFNYVVIVPGVILSQHQLLKAAFRGQAKAVSEGFTEAIIMERTPDGWKECSTTESSN